VFDGPADWRDATAMPLAILTSRPRWVGLLCLLVTAVGWGLNWPAMKLLLREWPPLSARGLAGLTAALALALLAASRGERLAVPAGATGRLLLAAALNVTAWMGLTTLSLLWLDAGQGALLTYTMPIWATLLAWPVRGERPTAGRALALALGVAGVAVLLGGGDGGSGSGHAGPGLLGPGRLPGVALALGEPLGAREALALALTLGGVSLALRRA
jgi:drug/metabolite transporter (DMT)-like permease